MGCNTNESARCVTWWVLKLLDIHCLGRTDEGCCLMTLVASTETLKSCTKRARLMLVCRASTSGKKRGNVASGVCYRSCVTTGEDLQVDGGRSRLEGQTSRSEIDRDGGCGRDFLS